MRQEAPCMEIRSSHRESRTGKRRELVEKRRVLRLLTNPEVRRKILLRRAYRNLSRWQRFMIFMGWAEFLLEDGEASPEYRIHWAGVVVWVVWVFALCLVAFLIIT